MTQAPVWKTSPESKRHVLVWNRPACRHAGSPELRPLTETLARDSAEFATLWNACLLDVPQLRRKRLRHPELGILDLTYAPLRPRGVAGDLSVVVYAT